MYKVKLKLNEWLRKDYNGEEYKLTGRFLASYMNVRSKFYSVSRTILDCMSRRF